MTSFPFMLSWEHKMTEKKAKHKTGKARNTTPSIAGIHVAAGEKFLRRYRDFRNIHFAHGFRYI